MIIGATAEGKKELVGFTDDLRESAHDWRSLLLDLKRRGLAMARTMLGEACHPERQSRSGWQAEGHKTANILNKLPKSQKTEAKAALQEIWMAEKRKAAESAFVAFIEIYSLKYDKAAECLRKDRDTLLAFDEFPAEHWKHLRTSNPIESTFAIVRHRTIRTKGCLSNETALAMVLKLVEGARSGWRKLDGHAQLPKVIAGVKFADGIQVTNQKAPQAQTAAA